MTLQELNTMNPEQAFESLFKCCGCTRWAEQLVSLRPFGKLTDLLAQSDRVWESCLESDALEAFRHHPKIGDMKSLEKKFASTMEWAGKEQSGVQAAAHETLLALEKGNKEYESKFGYIFIVCASGKSAGEMLELLEARIHNDAGSEMKTARAEQNKITHLRLEKLLA